MSGAAGPLSVAPVAEIPLRPRLGRRWALAFAAAVAATLALAWTVAMLLLRGVGLWGTNIPFVWGFDLINYVWWIGIGNAASLFAAVLVLRRHGLRTAVNRFAEAAALAAVLCAALFPILHLGRPWLFYWVFPYPSTMEVWPQFRSPLIWDFWGIMAHVVVTSLFWYVGLIPDLATLRDRAVSLREGTRRRAVARAYGVLALGWRGSMRHWSRHQTAYRLVAALVVPMLVTAQSAVALEFATTLVPGWHHAGMPLHVVATGLPSGLGVVLLLAVLLRGTLRLERYIDDGDMSLLARLLAAAALACAYAYAAEIHRARLSEPVVWEALEARLVGPYAPLYWGGVGLGVVLPQLLWWPAARRRPLVLAAVGLGAAAGVWLDRFSIVVGGLQHGRLPSAPELYAPTPPEWGLLIGTVGLFALVLLLFVRFVPVVSMFETRHEESGEEVP